MSGAGAGIHQSARERRRDYLRRTLGPRLGARYAPVAAALDEMGTVRTSAAEYLGPALPNVSERDRQSRALDARIFFTTVAVLEFERLVTERRRGPRRPFTPQPTRTSCPAVPFSSACPTPACAARWPSPTHDLQDPHRTVSPSSASALGAVPRRLPLPRGAVVDDRSVAGPTSAGWPPVVRDRSWATPGHVCGPGPSTTTPPASTPSCSCPPTRSVPTVRTISMPRRGWSARR